MNDESEWSYLFHVVTKQVSHLGVASVHLRFWSLSDLGAVCTRGVCGPLHRVCTVQIKFSLLYFSCALIDDCFMQIKRPSLTPK